MTTKEEMNIYHKMLNGKVVIKETLEETLKINENYIMFLEKRIKETKELLESIKIFVNKK